MLLSFVSYTSGATCPDWLGPPSLKDAARAFAAGVEVAWEIRPSKSAERCREWAETGFHPPQT